MINKLPIIGWLFSFIGSVSLSIPFWIVWIALADKYSYFIPEIYQEIPFWHCVGLFIVIPIVRELFTPKFASVSNTHNCEKGK